MLATTVNATSTRTTSSRLMPELAAGWEVLPASAAALSPDAGELLGTARCRTSFSVGMAGAVLCTQGMLLEEKMSGPADRLVATLCFGAATNAQGTAIMMCGELDGT